MGINRLVLLIADPTLFSSQELNSTFAMSIATASDQERVVRITQKGLTLVVVNRLHGIFGYDVVSHSMAMTNANRELVSFTLYKKSSPSSHGHGHSHSHSHSHSSHKAHTPHTHSGHGAGAHATHGNVVTL